MIQATSDTGNADALVFFIFDLLYVDGEDVSAAPLRDRKGCLQKLLASVPPPLQHSVHQLGRGLEFYARACETGLEVIVSKRADAPYVPNVLPDTDMEYFGQDGDRMHMMFNFQVNQNLVYALASADSRPLVKALEATKPRPATAQWGIFVRNHDELDLGRLTERQRQKVFATFGPDLSASRGGPPADQAFCSR